MAFLSEADRKLLAVGSVRDQCYVKILFILDLKSLNQTHVVVSSKVRNDVAEFPRNHQFPVSEEMLASLKKKKSR